MSIETDNPVYEIRRAGEEAIGEYKFASMPLRDYFAAAALTGICSQAQRWDYNPALLSTQAYKLADAMLKKSRDENE